jgi:DNA-binding CsgD family transcriptional regulator
MITAAELSTLIDLVYEASLTGAWEPVLYAAAGLLRSEKAGLFQYDTRSRGLANVVLAGIEPPRQESYASAATQRDMDQGWAKAAAIAVIGTPIIERYGADPELNRTELYQEWLRPQGIDQAVEIAGFTSPGSVAGMTVAVPASAVDPNGDAVVAMRLLRPHLMRAVQVRQRLDGVELERRQALEALDQLEQGMLLVDAQGHVRHANQMAQRILAAADGLAATGGALACDRGDDGRALLRLVGVAASDMAPGGLLAVRRRSGRRPYSVLVAPLRGETFAPLAPRGCAIVIVVDPDQAAPAPAAHLRALYGLTAAEARLALSLPEADGLRDLARRLGLGLATVRTHLQHVFEKTGTHRQAELVRLVMAHGPPAEA